MSDKTPIARRTAWYALLILVFLVPLVMTDFSLPGVSERISFSSIELVKLSLMRILTLIALGAWAWDILRRGGRLRHTPVDWLVLAWLVWVGFTTALSMHRPTALLGVEGRYEGFLTFVTYAVIYFLVLQFAEDSARIIRLTQSLFCAGVVVAIYGLLQYAGVVFLPDTLPWDETNRAFSTLGNPNMLGGFLVFTVTISLGLALHERKGLFRLAYWIGFGLNGLALIVSFTRGAWIGGVIAIILLGIIAWRRRISLNRVDWAPAGVFVVAAIAIIWRSLSDTRQVMNFWRRLTTIFEFSSGSGQTRTEIWHAAVSSIKSRPLTGWGADTFAQVFSRFKPAAYVRDAGSANAADNAHDYLLHLGSGVGIPGVLLFVGICGWVGIRSLKTVFARSGDPDHIVLGAFWAAAAGYLFHLLFSLSVPGVTFLLWITFALLLAPTARSKKIRPLKSKGWAAVGMAAVVVVVVLGIAGQAVVLAADREHDLAMEDFSPHPLSERIEAAEKARRLNPLASEHHNAVAAVWMEQAMGDLSAVLAAQKTGEPSAQALDAFKDSLATAVSAYEDAIAFTPNEYANYVDLASLYNASAPVLGDDLYDKTVQTAERGLEVMPLGTHIRMHLATAYSATDQVDDAARILTEIISIDPRDWGTAVELARLHQQRSRMDEAREVLEKALARTPGQAELEAALEALEAGQPIP